MEKYKNIELGNRIKVLRDQNNLSQAGLADIIGCSQGMIAKYEKGVVPASDILLRIARHFKASMDWLLTGDTTQPDRVAEDFAGFSAEVKIVAEYFEEKIKGRTPEERLKAVEEIMAEIRRKYK
jgi:transcriptional regulator with XRE-family HTH domain